MNYINNGDYYLVALYPNGEKEAITINKKWYFGREDVYQTAVDIAAIDIITTKFDNIEELKKQMLESKYIKSNDVDLFIARKNKYNNEPYVAKYELIFNNNERKELITTLGRKRLTNTPIELNDINNFVDKFLTKSFYTESFHRFITLPWCKWDNEIKNQLLIMNKEKNEKLKNDPNTKVKPSFNIKYEYSNRFTSYVNIRNIVYNWNLYDSSVENYKKENPNCTDAKMAKGIIDNYLEKTKNQIARRKEANDDLMSIVDKDNVNGQITINDYIKESEVSDEKGGIISSQQFEQYEIDPASLKAKEQLESAIRSEYDIEMDMMCKKEDDLKKSPFEDEELKLLEAKYGRDSVSRHLTKDILRTIGNADRYRLGLLADYVDYKNLIREEKRNNGKRRR